MSAQEQFVKLPRELLESDAWRSLSINARRVVDFLMIEHLRHGGRENGNLKAPKHQLVASGIGTHQVTAAIRETEERGLVECHRHGMRVASTYALTWLRHRDGSPATNASRGYRAPANPPENLGVKQHPGLGVKQHPGGPNLAVKQHPDASENLGAKQHPLSRKNSTRAAAGLSDTCREGTRAEAVEAVDLNGEAVAAAIDDAVVNGELPEAPFSPNPGKAPYSRCRFRVVTPLGDRVCDMLAPAGSDLCVDHAWRVPR